MKFSLWIIFLGMLAPVAIAAPFTIENAERQVREKYPDITRPSDELPTHVVADENLTYAEIAGEVLQLDIYRPEKRAPGAIVLIVHGGGWESGSRQMERPLAKHLAARGYVAVPVSYRLGPAGKFPGALDDLKAAIHWLRANAAKLALDDRPVGVIGGSAGGQLAALLRAENQAGLRIGAVVDIDGLADFTGEALVNQQAANPSAPVRFLGGNFNERPEVWSAASAITHVHAGSAPTLFLNSTVTNPILPGREEMRDKLKAAGVAAEIVVIPDTPHPFWLFHPWFERVVDESDRFLRAHLKP
ncbi:MAG TPA: alpha/beta hydrolase [Candidatus Didemnitutus sp.]|nr:alpha/beta hydrolase [Candidatus Didemnitutus sp.]